MQTFATRSVTSTHAQDLDILYPKVAAEDLHKLACLHIPYRIRIACLHRPKYWDSKKGNRQRKVVLFLFRVGFYRSCAVTRMTTNTLSAHMARGLRKSEVHVDRSSEIHVRWIGKSG